MWGRAISTEEEEQRTEANWLAELEVLQETEHFKLCSNPGREFVWTDYKENCAYFIIYKPLNKVEHATSSYNTARTLLWNSEALYEAAEHLFSIDPLLAGGNKKDTPPSPANGNTLN